jgi:ABC-type sugar transport system substrate-binding protein
MPKLVVALLDAAQEFQQLQASDAREAAARLALEVQVDFAEGHAVVQIQQLFKAIHAAPAERPLAIVVEPVTGEGLERVARNAVKAGIGWVLVNAEVAYLDELRAAHPELPIAIVGTDQREAGRIQGRQVRALAKGGGRVLCVQGPQDAAASLRRLDGLSEALGPGYELRGINADWTEAGGQRAVGSWLRLKTAEAFRPDVVVCQNDAMAIGARQALRENRPDWRSLPLLGCDGLPEGGQKQVAQGLLAGTVVTPSNTGPALELVVRWLRTKQQPPREVLLAPRSHPPEDRIAQRATS